MIHAHAPAYGAALRVLTTDRTAFISKVFALSYLLVRMTSGALDDRGPFAHLRSWPNDQTLFVKHLKLTQAMF